MAWPNLTEAEVAWQKLFEHLVVDAGERGVLRVYARLVDEYAPNWNFLVRLVSTSIPTNRFTVLIIKWQWKSRTIFKIRQQRKSDLFHIDQLYAPSRLMWCATPKRLTPVRKIGDLIATTSRAKSRNTAMCWKKTTK